MTGRVRQPEQRGTGPGRDLSEAYEQLTQQQLDAMLNAFTSRHSVLMSGLVGIAYLLFGLTWLGDGESKVGLALFVVAIWTGVGLLAFAGRARRQPIPEQYGVTIAGTIALAVTGTIILHYALTKDPADFYIFLIFQFACAAMILDRVWFVSVLMVSDLGWAITSAFIPGFDWPGKLGYLIGMTLVMFGMHVIRRRTMIRLEELRLAAERVAEVRSTFLANMSHEIRTPMSGVLGLTSLLLDTELTPKQHKMTAAIRDSAEALLTVLDEILDFSKLETGQIELEKVPFDLMEVLDGVVDLMRPRAEARGLRLDREIHGFTDTRLIGDPARIRQVLLNLLANAVKFTEAGFVTLTATQLDKGDSIRFRLAVHDTGIGVPARTLETIFNRFQQEDASTTRRFGGTGLGLPISKQLVELMGGEIGVSSTAEEGTTFFIELELERAHGGTTVSVITPIAELRTRGARVLVVEDNRTNLMVTEALLKKLSCIVDTATDGNEALERLASNEYDLVLMDCYMPVMDGFEATRQLRAAGSDIPILALTASVTEEDRKRCLDAGMNDTIAKPVRLEILGTALGQWLDAESGDAQRKPSASSETRAYQSLDPQIVQQLRMLDEDDDGFMQEVMDSFLKQLRSSIQRLDAAVAGKDLQTIQRTAHTIKGASRQVGATKVGNLFATIEQEPDLNKTRGLVEQVRSEVPQVEEAVRLLLESSA